MSICATLGRRRPRSDRRRHRQAAGQSHGWRQPRSARHRHHRAAGQSQGRRLPRSDRHRRHQAREERVTAAYIYTLLPLPWLAPDITPAIIDGRQPQQFNTKTLMRTASRLPVDWAEQRALLGFQIRCRAAPVLSGAPLQQKSKPRTAPREIFLVTASRLRARSCLCSGRKRVSTRNMRQMAGKQTREGR
jgi:hypothetical protein